MIYSTGVRVNITRVQIDVCEESDVVSLMQNWIHPLSLVAAAASFFTLDLHAGIVPDTPPLLASDQPEWCSDLACSAG